MQNLSKLNPEPGRENVGNRERLSGKDFCEIVLKFYRQCRPQNPFESSLVYQLNNIDVCLKIQSEQLEFIANNLMNFFHKQIVYSNNFMYEKNQHKMKIQNVRDALVDVSELIDQLERMRVSLNVADRNLEFTPGDRETLVKYEKVKYDSNFLANKLAKLESKIREKSTDIETLKSRDRSVLNSQSNNQIYQISQEELEEIEDIKNKINKLSNDNVGEKKILKKKNSRKKSKVNYLLVDDSKFMILLNMINKETIRYYDIPIETRCFPFFWKKYLDLKQAIDSIEFKNYRDVFIVILNEYEKVKLDLKEYDKVEHKNTNFIIFTVAQNLESIKIESNYKFIKTSRTTILSEENAVEKLCNEIERLNKLDNQTESIQHSDSEIGLNNQTISELEIILDQKLARIDAKAQNLASSKQERMKLDQNQFNHQANRIQSLETEKSILESDARQLRNELEETNENLYKLEEQVNEINKNQQRNLENALKTPIEYVEFNKKLIEFKVYLSSLQNRKTFIRNKLNEIMDALDKFEYADQVDSFFNTNKTYLEEFLNFIRTNL